MLMSGEGKTPPKSLKKFLEKFKKTLDKRREKCYNKYVIKRDNNS